IVWSPSVINPGLRPGLRLAVISTTRHRMPVLDAEGRPLQTRSTAFVAGVRPDRLKDPAATADALGRATGIEPSEVLRWILAAQAVPGTGDLPARRVPQAGTPAQEGTRPDHPAPAGAAVQQHRARGGGVGRRGGLHRPA